MHTRCTWLFDLDNTLHDASPHIFPHINRSMTAYMSEHLRLSEAEAADLRAHYWRRYGATLHGLMRHHGTDPSHFLWHTHQFPDLARMVVAEAGLAAMLARLPGRKILFSNSPLHYAEAMLDILDIARCFDAVYAIERTRFRPKPSLAGLRLVLQKEAISAHRCVLVEDTLANLRPAKQLGLKTVWVTREVRLPACVDVKLASVLTLPRALRRLGIHA
jgi:putative hydrolase of the HAD superfamily